MQLVLTTPVVKRLQRELRRARRREIGGLLLGEHLGGELFSVVDISVQRMGGTDSCFTRAPGAHQDQLEKFFTDTGRDYARFNYLGEWHSHPGFEPIPSETDFHTMQSLVEDPEVGVNFAVLLITKLGKRKHLEATVTAFRANATPISVPLLVESGPVADDGFTRKWLSRLFGRNR
jgi:integrative and conjugative element protein (TIGR02256 family)